ncbi:hypothetical protein M2119_000001, partial [Aurantimicrobium minutum]|nr:hypothetical protein [Aurantimicrobium minutum]
MVGWLVWLNDRAWKRRLRIYLSDRLSRAAVCELGVLSNTDVDPLDTDCVLSWGERKGV